jgi:hypothetical protein
VPFAAIVADAQIEFGRVSRGRSGKTCGNQ